MRLIRYHVRSVHPGSGVAEEASVDLLTGGATLREGSIGSHASHERRVSTTRRGIVCLQDVGDGFAFDPAIGER